VPYLAGAIVLIGAIAVLNLILTFGVIRRLREDSERLAGGAPPMPEVMLTAGASPDAFVATTTDGERVSQELLTGDMLVGFFSPHCGPCKELAPRFVERAAAVPGGRSRVLAVLVGERHEMGELLPGLERVARVVVERDIDAEGTVSHAFAVRGFPAVCTLDRDGRVASSGFELSVLREPSLAS
jgi:thiol-disulfide isomerase/thioredoxin